MTGTQGKGLFVKSNIPNVYINIDYPQKINNGFLSNGDTITLIYTLKQDPVKTYKWSDGTQTSQKLTYIVKGLQPYHQNTNIWKIMTIVISSIMGLLLILLIPFTIIKSKRKKISK